MAPGGRATPASGGQPMSETPSEGATMATIVVGVDGSPGAREALRFALGEARLRAARLRVVATWDMSVAAYGGMKPGQTVEPGVFRGAARASLDASLAALGDQAHGVDIDTVVRRGQPAQVLLDEARGADLLVVGSRGHGGFVGLLLGSVSHQCALHGPCPVVIVHERHEPE
jgi:nucleotide-binding universal stress UspA family protein